MLIFVYGGDGVAVSEKTGEMRKRFLQKFDPTGMNLAEFPSSGSLEVPFGEIVQAIQSAPFLGEKRMVIVRGLLMTLKKAAAAPWVDALRRTPPSTIVVLVDNEEAKVIEKHAVFVGCKDVAEVHSYVQEKLEGEVRVRWIISRAKEHGAMISRDVAQKLSERIGDDGWRLGNEIAKISAYAGKNPISLTMLDELVGRDSVSSIFALVDAIMASNGKTACRLLRDERDAGSEDLYILAMLARQIRLLVQVRSYMDGYASVDKRTIAAAFGLHPFVVQKTMLHAKRFSLSALRETHALLTKMDRDTKRGKIGPTLAVDRVVAQLLMA